MKVVALQPLHCLASNMSSQANVPLVEGLLNRFPNGELQVEINGRVAGEDCAVLGSLTPPDEHLLGFSLLCHTLKKEGARSIRAVLPYLAYARQDRDEPGKSLATGWIGTLLQASGVDSVVTVDVHNEQVERLFPVPLDSLSPAQLFAGELKNLDLRQITVVAPDEGACRRCEALREAASIERPVAWFTKERTAYGIRHLSLNGTIGHDAVIVDDILDTGETLVSACKDLQRRAVRRIVIMVTHALFTGTVWNQLWRYGVESIVCTDSVPMSEIIDRTRINVLPIAPLLATALQQPAIPAAA